MSVNIQVTGGLNIEWGQIDPKVTGGLKKNIPAAWEAPLNRFQSISLMG